MRWMFNWTIIFQGNIYSSILQVLISFYKSLFMFVRIIYAVARVMLRISLAIFAINWYRIEDIILRR